MRPRSLTGIGGLSMQEATDAINAVVLVAMRAGRRIDVSVRVDDPDTYTSPHEIRRMKLAEYRRELRRCLPCSHFQLPIYVDPLEQGCGLRHLDPEERAACRDIEVRIWNGRLERIEQHVRGLVRATRPQEPSFWERIVTWWRRRNR